MIKIEWNEQLLNAPRIILEEELAVSDISECEFDHLKNGIWLHIQTNGLARYFYHSGSDLNEGGYGGAVFTIKHDGKVKQLKGPWSSRATVVNMVSDIELVDIILEARGGRRPIAITVNELLKRWDLPYYLVRAKPRKNGLLPGEPGAVTPSVRPDCIEKPSGMRVEEGEEYEVVSSPVSGE